MVASSNMRRIGVHGRGGAPAGLLPVPDPRTWPAEIRAWYRAAVGACGPCDVFVFDYGRYSAMYLQDAVTAAAVIEIDLSEWHVEQGYPAVICDPERISEVERYLGLVGYKVHVLQPLDCQQHEPGKPT